MTAADMLRRSENRSRWSRFGALLLGILVLLVAIAVAVDQVYGRGVKAGRAIEKSAQIRQALEDNSEKLRVAGVHRDSTKKKAAAAVVASETHRDSSRKTVGQLQVTSPTTIQVADLPPLVMPKLAVDAIVDLKEGRRRDSVTIASLKADVRALEVKDSLSTIRDSLHVEREHQLERDVKAEGKRGFWRGVKAGAVATVVVVGAILIGGD